MELAVRGGVAALAGGFIDLAGPLPFLAVELVDEGGLADAAGADDAHGDALLEIFLQRLEALALEGAGDVVPESLQQIGYNVVTIKPEDITAESLNRFDAIVVGIRAYNTLEELKFKQQTLFDFVAEGGNMIVQYNTSHRLKVEALAPYPLKLSRDRVTDETAKVTLLNPDHELLNFPNKITEKDFKELLNNFDNIALWKEKFPPNSYIFKGFGIMHLFDVTAEEMISSIKANLLKDDENLINNIENNLKDFYNELVNKY